MTWWLAIVTVLWMAAWLAAVRIESDPTQRLPGAPTADGGAPEAASSDVDVVVPARNEEANVGPLLESLRAQTLAPRTIVVVDDASTDRTAAIVEEHARLDARVRLVRGEGPPPGWTGKTAALARGVAETRAPWLLFVDADVRLAPGNLAEARAEANRRAWDGISLWGRWETPSFGARLLQCVVGGFVRGAHPIPRVNDPSRPDAFLNGQYLLIRRAAYDELGGWESVRDRVLEDVAFARRAKPRGVRIGLLLAPDRMTVVPYRSLREAWAGYRKNFVAGAGGAGRALAAAGVVFAGSVLPFLVLAWDVATWPSPWPRIAAGGAACAAAIAYRIGTADLFHHPRRDAVWHPVANALFVALILAAVADRLGGRGAQWKGRRIEEGPAAR